LYLHFVIANESHNTNNNNNSSNLKLTVTLNTSGQTPPWVSVLTVGPSRVNDSKSSLSQQTSGIWKKRFKSNYYILAKIFSYLSTSFVFLLLICQERNTNKPDLGLRRLFKSINLSELCAIRAPKTFIRAGREEQIQLILTVFNT